MKNKHKYKHKYKHKHKHKHTYEPHTEFALTTLAGSSLISV